MISSLLVVVLLSATAVTTTVTTTTPALLVANQPAPSSPIGATAASAASAVTVVPVADRPPLSARSGPIVGAAPKASAGSNNTNNGGAQTDGSHHHHHHQHHQLLPPQPQPQSQQPQQSRHRYSEGPVEYVISQRVNVTTKRIVRDTNESRQSREVVVSSVVIGPNGDGSASRSVGGPQPGDVDASAPAPPTTTTTTTTTSTTATNKRPTRSSNSSSNAGTNDGGPIYTNQFVIQVAGGETEARNLAQRHGYVYLNHILGDFYHLAHERLARRSLSEYDLNSEEAQNSSDSIQDEPQVLKFERQVLKRRVKRDFLDLAPPTATTATVATRIDQQQLQHHLNQLQQHIQRNPGSRPSGGGGGGSSDNRRPINRQPQQSQVNHYQLTRPANQAPNSSHMQPQQFGRLHSAEHRLELEYNQASRIGLAPPPVPVEPLEAAASSSSSVASSSGSLPLHKQLLQHQLAHQQSAAAGSRQRPSNGTGAATGTTSHLYANSSSQAPFNDPSWPLMWYLDGGARNGFDLNVQAAWKMGYTGKGIVITILDDGLEKDHPDLQANYDPLASFDINGDDADPMPRYDPNDSNRHGTRCAGEVAAVPDNNICSIGIAYNSKVGGVRMLDGDVTDAVEARSLGLNNQHIHIYSASWGPDDNGKTVDGPGELATRAFIEGVTNGRQGLGSIFVFASGNGGREHDNCNCDGYTNSIWTLSISSATENGFVPWYIEACSSTLATTYSSGSYDERQIATTDLHHTCTSNHTGTSASAPLAAGICALVLESNPRLTWRDMQHIVVKTAKPANLVAKDWRTNAMGRNVSHAFGYGLMDAAAMITMAKRWTTVPTQYTCEVSTPPMERSIPAKGSIELKLRAECTNIRYLEHVQSKVTLSASRRGDLHIYLTSPGNTRSTLLAQRPNDQAEQGFRKWPFMTVHSWGESPNGVWTLEVHNDGKPQNRAYLKEWTLILYGTKEDPNQHLSANSMASSQTSGGATPAPPQYPGRGHAPGGHHHNHQHGANNHQHLRPGGHHGGVSAPSSSSSSSSPPPPPISVPPTQGISGGFGQQPAISTHWSIQPPVPGPIGTATGAEPQPQPPPTSTPASTSTISSTTSSYVTTFKTVLSSSPPDGPQPAGSGAAKADFEIVSPTAGRPPGAVLVSTPPTATTTTTTTTTTATATILMSANNDSSLVQPPTRIWPSIAESTTGASKPPINHIIEGNKIDTNTGMRVELPVGVLFNNKRPVGGHTQDSGAGQYHDAGLDINQLDLKQTKDYRSSGGQDSNHLAGTQTATTTTTTSATTTVLATNELGSGDYRQQSGKSSEQRQQNSAGSLKAGHSVWVSILIGAILCQLVTMATGNFRAGRGRVSSNKPPVR